MKYNIGDVVYIKKGDEIFENNKKIVEFYYDLKYCLIDALPSKNMICRIIYKEENLISELELKIRKSLDAWQ